MYATTFLIPDTADVATNLRYQAACVERAQLLLLIRGAQRANHTIPESAQVRLNEVTNGLAQLEKTYRIAFAITCQALNLDGFQREALATAAAIHFDHRLREAIGHFWGQPSRRYVDAALCVELMCGDPVERVARGAQLREGSPLHAAGLLESAATPTVHAPTQLEFELVATPRLLRLFNGLVGLDPRFRGIAQLVPANPNAAMGVVEPERLKHWMMLVGAADRAIHRGASVLIAGSAGTGKLRLAQTLSAVSRRMRLLVVEASELPTEPVRLGQMIEALAKEAELLTAALVFRRVDAFATDASLSAHLRHALQNASIRSWLTSDVDPARVGARNVEQLATLNISVTPGDVGLRHVAWRTELARVNHELDEADLAVLASEYPLSRSSIEVAARMASAIGPSLPHLRAVLPQMAESQMPGQLGRYTKRSRSKVRLADVVLTDNTREQVVELLEALRRRRSVMDRWGVAEHHAIGRGIVALFNGPPGTGKTLTAAALANEIGMPLYRIDASSIVDRFVGETEKNLVRLFDEAVASRAALLFDEADSLFGKRVEAEDASDRYANLQVNTLLNLIEDYDGFVVLTTNIKGALDDAFLRRIIYKIIYEKPEEEQIVALWEYHLPTSVKRGPDMNLGALAEEFDQLAGGDIKNAVLRATLGAKDDEPITQQMLRRAVINELRANGAVVAG